MKVYLAIQSGDGIAALWDDALEHGPMPKEVR